MTDTPKICVEVQPYYETITDHAGHGNLSQACTQVSVCVSVSVCGVCELQDGISEIT